MQIRSANRYDIDKLLPYLRREDVQEITIKKKTPFEALENCFIKSEECYSLLLNENIIGLFGLIKVSDKAGAIWFLGAEDIKKIPVFFVKQGKKTVNEWLKKYQILFNYTDSRNKVHHKWLEHIGAKIDYNSPVNVNGVDFYFFKKERE